MPIVPGIFAVLLATVGGYYLLVSPAAGRLEEFEGADINRRRVRLRRINGATIILLSAAVFTLGAGLARRDPWLVLFGLLGVLVLLLAALTMALIDIRLTQRLRNRQREQREAAREKSS